MSINEIVEEITRIQHEKGHRVFWKKNCYFKTNDLTVGEALCMTAGELDGEAMEEFRNDNKTKFVKELAGALLRLCHIVGDVCPNVDFSKVVEEEIKRCKTRPYLHGRKKY